MHPHEFEHSYSGFMPAGQEYMPAYLESPYTTYDSQSHIQAVASGPHPEEYPYDFKYSYPQPSPLGSPHSGSHSFDNQPPQLSTSSESGASVSPSAVGSPSLGAPQYVEPAWAPLEGLGIAPGLQKDVFHPEQFVTSAFEFDGLVATCNTVGESSKVSSPGKRDSLIASPSCNVFKSPTIPASALPGSLPFVFRREHLKTSVAGPGIFKPRRNSLLSSEIFPDDAPNASPTAFSSSSSSQSPSTASISHSRGVLSSPLSPCWFPLPSHLL